MLCRPPNCLHIAEAEKKMFQGEVFELLPWDSEHFGVSIGRATGDVNPDRAIAWARREDLQCLYLLADRRDVAAVHEAIAAGFTLSDLRVTLEYEVGDDIPQETGIGIRTMERADLPALQTIAQSAHIDSRFYADSRFDRGRVADMYRDWLRGSLLGGLADWALTAVDDGVPVGYVTGRTEAHGVANIGLLGVADVARRHGFGRRLIKAFIREASESGCSHVIVSTQAANVLAQRLYQGVGFRTLRTQAWLHWWA